MNVDAKDSIGLTAFHHACFNLNLEMMEYLLSKGANPNIKNENSLYDESMLGMIKRFKKEYYNAWGEEETEVYDKAIELLKRYGAE